MTAASTPAAARPALVARMPGRAAWRLLRLELRRNTMLWMVPLVAVLFWYGAYRDVAGLPPLWNLRAMTMQHAALLDFEAPLVGAAAWMGSREGRRGMTDLMAGTPRPRWGAQLAVWAATTSWAMLAYLGCVGFLYLETAQHAAGSGPLWWPAAVGAAGIPALSAIGFTAGALRPTRFTAPLVTVATFFALGLGSEAAHGARSYWQVAPLISGPADIGPDQGVATFYRYLPDLSIAQVMFLAGLTIAILGLLGMPASAGGRWLRRSAAAITAAGLVAAATAVALAGTGRMDIHGMIVIPALHDAANDGPIRYTPVCDQAAIPVCLQPAYAAYLPIVTAALKPVLSEVAGMPGAPVRISPAAPTYELGSDHSVGVGMAGPAVSGTPPVFRLLLPEPLPGLTENGAPITNAEFAAEVQANAAATIVDTVVYGSSDEPPAGGAAARPRDQARAAVAAGLLRAAGLPRPGSLPPGAPRPGPGGTGPVPGTPAYAAARRFAALPASGRRGWLVAHLAELRAGRITVAQLP
jgi:hypothetical protein